MSQRFAARAGKIRGSGASVRRCAYRLPVDGPPALRDRYPDQGGRRSIRLVRCAARGRRPHSASARLPNRRAPTAKFMSLGRSTGGANRSGALVSRGPGCILAWARRSLAIATACLGLACAGQRASELDSSRVARLDALSALWSFYKFHYIDEGRVVSLDEDGITDLGGPGLRPAARRLVRRRGCLREYVEMDEAPPAGARRPPVRLEVEGKRARSPLGHRCRHRHRPRAPAGRTPLLRAGLREGVARDRAGHLEGGDPRRR